MSKEEIYSHDAREFNKKVGKMIRHIRMSQGKSLSEVHKQTGVITKGSLSYIERGKQNIHAVHLWELSKAFNCEILDFFAFDTLVALEKERLERDLKIASLEQQIQRLRNQNKKEEGNE